MDEFACRSLACTLRCRKKTASMKQPRTCGCLGPEARLMLKAHGSVKSSDGGKCFARLRLSASSMMDSVQSFRPVNLLTLPVTSLRLTKSSQVIVVRRPVTRNQRLTAGSSAVADPRDLTLVSGPGQQPRRRPAAPVRHSGKLRLVSHTRWCQHLSSVRSRTWKKSNKVMTLQYVL